jgi:HD-GYP domain-containing protein (c-di-GMP phosphodiesterase class II)
MNAFTALEQNALSFKLKPISVRELFFLGDTPCDIYGVVNGLYKIILKEGSYLDNKVLKDLIEQGHAISYVLHEARLNIIAKQQDNLRQVTRSLSIGDALEKGKKQLALISINMRYLYEDPTNDDTLSLQFQSVKNLASFLFDRPELYSPLYYAYIKQKHHYIFAQPLLSSLFLLGCLKQSRLYSQKEIENLFITSFFKDIGMSAIPTQKYDEEELSDEDKILLAKHAELSVQILNGRVQISPTHLKIIENHHTFSLLSKNYKMDNLETDTSDKVISGFETMIISVMDIISAMIAERPYREATTLFDSLELVKILIADQYPQEFKLVVNYFKNFFFKKKRLG